VCVAETLRQALHSLAIGAPAWLQAHSRPEGLERDGPRGHDDSGPTDEQTHRA
jgi:hypothetical protein